MKENDATKQPLERFTEGDRVTGPGSRPSAPRERYTFVRVETVNYPRSGPGYFAILRTADGREVTTALGLVLSDETERGNSV